MSEGILIALIPSIGLIVVALINCYKPSEEKSLVVEESVEIVKPDGTRSKRKKKKYWH